MILDGVMVILASTCLTVYHQGIGFQSRWRDAEFQFRKTKATGDRETSQITGDGGSKGSEKAGPQVSEALTEGVAARSLQA